MFHCSFLISQIKNYRYPFKNYIWEYMVKKYGIVVASKLQEDKKDEKNDW